MEKIGKLLKEKRLEQGQTIEDVSEKTRLTIKHIKAIEEGDISYFKNDLSYLRFFLKSYCDVLHLDFELIKEELRDSIDDYTTTFSQDAVHQHEAIERNVRENADKMKHNADKKDKPKKKKKAKKARHRRKPDMSLLSFLAIIIVVIIGLIFAFVMWIQGSKNPDDYLAENKPPVPSPTEYTSDPEEPVKQPEKPVDEKKEMKITPVSDIEYTIENLADDENIDIEITFGSNSSFRALVDGVQKTDPAQATYQYKKVIHVRDTAVKGKKIQLAFGFMMKNTVKVNGQEISFPASVTNKQGSAVITLNVKGE